MKPGDEWFEVSEDLWKGPNAKAAKLRLLADHNIAAEMVKELREADIDVRTASEEGKAHLPDEELLAYAGKIGRVLLTMDEDFWSDRKHRLHKGAGVIIVKADSKDVNRSLRAFGLLFGCFAQSYGNWDEMKAKAYPDRFVLKLPNRTMCGGVVQYEMRLFSRRLYAKEVPYTVK